MTGDFGEFARSTALISVTSSPQFEVVWTSIGLINLASFTGSIWSTTPSFAGALSTSWFLSITLKGPQAEVSKSEYKMWFCTKAWSNLASVSWPLHLANPQAQPWGQIPSPPPSKQHNIAFSPLQPFPPAA